MVIISMNLTGYGHHYWCWIIYIVYIALANHSKVDRYDFPKYRHRRMNGIKLVSINDLMIHDSDIRTHQWNRNDNTVEQITCWRQISYFYINFELIFFFNVLRLGDCDFKFNIQYFVIVSQLYQSILSVCWVHVVCVCVCVWHLDTCRFNLLSFHSFMY